MNDPLVDTVWFSKHLEKECEETPTTVLIPSLEIWNNGPPLSPLNKSHNTNRFCLFF